MSNINCVYILYLVHCQTNGVTRWQLTRSKGEEKQMTFMALPVYTLNNVYMGRILSFDYDNNKKKNIKWAKFFTLELS